LITWQKFLPLKSGFGNRLQRQSKETKGLPNKKISQCFKGRGAGAQGGRGRESRSEVQKWDIRFEAYCLKGEGNGSEVRVYFIQMRCTIFYNFSASSSFPSEKSRGVLSVLYAVSLVADIVDS
jgi:hypothetical protein